MGRGEAAKEPTTASTVEVLVTPARTALRPGRNEDAMKSKSWYLKNIDRL